MRSGKGFWGQVSDARGEGFKRDGVVVDVVGDGKEGDARRVIGNGLEGICVFAILGFWWWWSMWGRAGGESWC